MDAAGFLCWGKIDNTASLRNYGSVIARGRDKSKNPA